MRVIKPGTLPGTKIVEVTCGHCKQVTEFRKDELTYEDDQRESWYVVVCPLCKNRIIVGSNRI